MKFRELLKKVNFEKLLPNLRYIAVGSFLVFAVMTGVFPFAPIVVKGAIVALI